MTNKPNNLEDLKNKLLERLDFLSDHWVKGDDRPPFNFGGWREEIASDFVNIVLNREKKQKEEIVKMGEKMRSENRYVYSHNKKIYNQTISDYQTKINS